MKNKAIMLQFLQILKELTYKCNGTVYVGGDSETSYEYIDAVEFRRAINSKMHDIEKEMCHD